MSPLVRADLARLHRVPEPQTLARLADEARLSPRERESVAARAAGFIAAVRSHKAAWVEGFLREYGLSEGEGVALMGLAEAYLRVPDAHTAGSLIEDKLAAGDWRAHLGAPAGLAVNVATFGFVMTKSLMTAAEDAPLRRMAGRLGEPAIRKAVGAAMQMMGGHFVLGRTIDEALKRAGRDICSFDMLGEAAKTADDAGRYFEAYRHAIATAGAAGDGGRPIAKRHSVSVKLSALYPRYEELHAASARRELSARLIELAKGAAAANIGLTVDAEEADRLVLSLDIIGDVAAAPELRGWDGLGMAIQAYSKRAPAVIAWAQETGLATGRRMQVRLVKGAYWDSEVKRAQEQGQADYPVFTRKAATDVSYLACARRMLDASHIQPAFATHNALTVAVLLHWIGDRRDLEFQRLHGMGEALHARMTRETGIACRVYAPVGGYRDLLAYLVRRLLENGANSSFVHQAADPATPVEDLLEDPVETVEAAGFAMHPAIPLPVDLYGAERRNSEGVDLSDRQTLKDTADAIAAFKPIARPARPLIAGRSGGEERAARPVVSPNDTTRLVGSVIEATAADVTRAVDVAHTAFPAWSARPVEERAAILDRMADLLEAERLPLMTLAVQEAGKSIPDAVAEVREAVDFCRYYAVQARRLFAPQLLKGPTGERDELFYAGRGVFACISPWNFPLAIFVGQVAAALAAGNAVVAKAAPQTPLIAEAAVRLFHRAGAPPEVLAFVPGGAEAGGTLVADARIAGVAFTGSTGTARRIALSLLEDEKRPLVPLIAETGGINAMIVDSTALPEQVVTDVVTSALQSAGQRCSALRLLCLQEDIADRVIEMLKGAMDQLVVGDSADPATDVGPVIDATARDAIETYLSKAEAAGAEVHRLTLPDAARRGPFVAPTIVRLDRVEDLTREVFGPVLHVATWKAGGLSQLVERINASGYGLTMGLHSRLASAAEEVRSLAKVGNLYVNRSMIGAVVGVQPFGGEGLSGTGPKAGGPNYLLRFSVERTVSTDTTSAGGNASLMNMVTDLI